MQVEVALAVELFAAVRAGKAFWELIFAALFGKPYRRVDGVVCLALTLLFFFADAQFLLKSPNLPLLFFDLGDCSVTSKQLRRMSASSCWMFLKKKPAAAACPP